MFIRASHQCAQETVRISFGEPSAEYGLPELLPQRFGPADLLGDSGVPLLLEAQHNGVVFAAGSASAALLKAAVHQISAGSSSPATAAAERVSDVTAGAELGQPLTNGTANTASVLEAAAKKALQAANQVHICSRRFDPALQPGDNQQ